MPDRSVTPEIIRELLDYDPTTGALTWRKRPQGFAQSSKACAQWNGKWAGKRALNCPNGDGYLMGSILGRPARAHRVAWCCVTGAWPTYCIDHINGLRSDNRWINLREATPSQNMRNQKMRENNTSGRTGVTWHAGKGAWEAFIFDREKRLHLGTFRLLDDAMEARSAAEVRLGYHPNHGRNVA